MKSALEQAMNAVKGLFGQQKIISPVPDEIVSPLPPERPTSGVTKTGVKWRIVNNPPSPTPSLNPSTPENLVPLVISSAKKHGIPPHHFSNLLARESMQFNPDVMSGKMNSPMGAQGVGQWMPESAKWWAEQYGEFDPLVPEQAIPASAAYLGSLNKRFNSLPATYAAYNAGPGRVAGALNDAKSFEEALRKLSPETQQYVPAVMGDDF